MGEELMTAGPTRPPSAGPSTPRSRTVSPRSRTHSPRSDFERLGQPSPMSVQKPQHGPGPLLAHDQNFADWKQPERPNWSRNQRQQSNFNDWKKPERPNWRHN